MPLRFNMFLEQAGLNPDEVKVYLLRHEDKRLAPGRLLSAWFNERDKFEAYQAAQKWKNRFDVGSYLASFVVTPGRETLFVGLYHVLSQSEHVGPSEDPLGKLPPERYAEHETERSDKMQEYEGRIVIDWEAGTKAWRQIARNVNNKVVLEFRREFREAPFPGYKSFRDRLAELRNIYPSWIERLEEARGVYLLVFDDGVQYVGSAAGAGGFWQRWEEYLANGHGGNKILIRDHRDARNAMVSILETSGSRETRDDILKREMFLQRVLGSRAKALDTEIDS
jgi:hypothetical protein